MLLLVLFAMPSDVATIDAVASAACGHKSLVSDVGDGVRRKKPFFDVDDVGDEPADDDFGTLKFDIVADDVLRLID